MGDIPMSGPMIESVSHLFVALADPSRLKVMRCLMDSDQPVNQGDVAKSVGLSQANASKHLSILVRVGLVERCSRGNAVFFSPVMPLAGELCDLICGHVSRRAEAAFHALV